VHRRIGAETENFVNHNRRSVQYILSESKLALNKKLAPLIIIILAVSAILAALPMASAEIYSKPTLNPTSGPPGTKVTVAAGPGGASAFTIVSAYWDNRTGLVLNSTAADNNGAYMMVVTIPPAPNGLHWIIVNDGESESEGAQFTVTAGMVVSDYSLGVVQPLGSGEVYVNRTLHTGDVLGFNLGEVANITAVPNSGWTFERWIYGDDKTSNPWYHTITGNMIAWAVFTVIPPDSFETIRHNVTVETDTYVVETVSNSSVSEFVFNGTAIRLQVEGDSGTAGLCNVTVPSELMSGEFAIYIDAILLIENVDYTESYNGTHHLFSITYEPAAHMIEITATTVIPEFSSLITLTLLGTATLTTLIAKKKLKR